MNGDLPLEVLFGALVVLLLLSAFFSSSETALMSLNRYRLRHRAREGHRGSRIAEQLLARPDRLIGLILLGNNLVNISAASLTTIICIRLGGESAIAIGTGLLTLAVLIFAEVAPKTMAALKPERIALPASYVYYPALKLLYPAVWVVNLLANGVLLLFGIRTSTLGGDTLSREELRTVVQEAGAMISRKYQRMLISILDLEKVTVEDVMIPRQSIVGIDLQDDIDDIVTSLQASDHTRLPVYRDSIDNVIGILHLRRVIRALNERTLTKDGITRLVSETYFVPEGTPLSTQLVQFQKRKRRVAMIVDEYGDLQGMVTLEDILEEIVGEFTTDPAADEQEIVAADDDSYVVTGGIHLRDLNRVNNWRLPTSGPKTLNGLIVEQLESIPDTGTVLEIGRYSIEILEKTENMVRRARLREQSATEAISAESAH